MKTATIHFYDKLHSQPPFSQSDRTNALALTFPTKIRNKSINRLPIVGDIVQYMISGILSSHTIIKSSISQHASCFPFSSSGDSVHPDFSSPSRLVFQFSQ
eukprot:TRINITY_DN51013_c0_g1_i1.p1 TRINITY_DN51013_c0_g1~~TRINITY_DN51013_c0_g1_i1.p1  ORF type:complete len:101 (+),score=11.36 TRINITY_DN51013_c0_g1_i1:534-836(+)